MLDLTLTKTVPRSLDTVWTYVVTDFFANHRRWDPAIVELRKLTDGAVRQGTRGMEVRNFGGRQAAEFTVTSYRDRESFMFVNDTGPFDLRRSYDLAPTPTGCSFTFRFVMRPKGAMRLLFPLVRRTVETQVRQNIDRLAELLATTP